MLKNNYIFSSIKRAILVSCLVVVGALSSNSVFAADPALHYSFESSSIVNDTIVNDLSGNGYNGKLKNEALVMYDATLDMNVLDLGMGDGYLDMQAKTGELVSTLTDFTICTYMYVGPGAALTSNGNMLWAFANSDDSGTDAAGYMFWHAKGANRYAITPTLWSSEIGAGTGVNTTTEVWHHVAVTQKGSLITVYYDGIEKGSSVFDMTPSDLGFTTSNYIGKPCYKGDKYLLDSKVADFRIYSSALEASEIFALAGPTAPIDYPQSILLERDALDLGDLDGITANITLPLTGTTDTDVIITWESSNRTIIDTLGNVTQPTDLDGTVVLTATITKADSPYSVQKKFTATVPASGGFAVPLILDWKFDADNVDGVVVTDAAEKHFEGSMMDGAKVRTIGTEASGQFNTLDLGVDNGYFDMGTEVGKLIYGLSDFTISAYFLVDTAYKELSWNGNFLWNFSNSDDVGTEQNGNMSLRLIDQRYFITPKYYGADQQVVNPSLPPTQGVWHHVAYVQEGTKGTVYVDGVVGATGTITNLPSTTLVQNGREGTYYNWIGRACYVGDVFLRNTLVYGFQVYNIGASADDINELFVGTIAELDAAYKANPDPLFPQELLVEKENLSLGDISALTDNISLPETLDNDVTVTWTTSNSGVIDVWGEVIRPTDLDIDVVLTAKLSKNGYSVTKSFTATVKASSGFQSTLLLQYNFENQWVNDTLITDAAEKHYVGSLKQGAKIKTIGAVGSQINVLDLGEKTDSAYFDMGEDVGKLIYGLKEYSISLYFLIDSSYTEAELGAPGNFIYSFSNTDSALVDQNGYMFGQVSKMVHCISSNYWQTGNEQTANAPAQPSRGNWHHMVYTQTGKVGTMYLDGDTLTSQTFNNLPSIALPKDGLVGTKYNWIGRSCYSADNYLHKTLVSDFRLYNESLTPETIGTMNSQRSVLNNAYSTASAVSETILDNVTLDASKAGVLKISGINSNDVVSIYDLTGRLVKVEQSTTIYLAKGLYIVKVNNVSAKVIIK